MASDRLARIEAQGFNPKRELCARCGEVAEGYAYIDGDRLCHLDDGFSCYVGEQLSDAVPLDQWLGEFLHAERTLPADDGSEFRMISG